MKKTNYRNLKLIIIELVLLVISICTYKYIFEVETTRRIYAEETEKFVEENKNPIFSIDKIILCSSATAVDNSDGKLNDLNISQYTDISLYINNKGRSEEITAENTVNQLFINNIKVENQIQGSKKIFNYKNPLYSGKYVELPNWQNDGILFNVVNTNEKNENANYDENIFYTDCSNPISLGYINKNFLVNGVVNRSNAVINFDGSILKDAEVDLETLKTKISFSVNLTNNFNENFVCNVSLDIDLDSENEEIYSGSLIKILDLKEDKFNFIKVSS